MSFPRYPKYKASGVEWLEDVPEGWDVKRLKYVATLSMGQSPSSNDCNSDGNGLPFLQGNADFGDIFPLARSFCPVAAKIARTGDILFSVRAPVGAINTADQEYGIGRGLCAITASEYTFPRYLRYELEVIKSELFSVATGSTYEAVSTQQVGNATCILPSLAEQNAIAEFLDRETAKIDELVAEQRFLMELLKEKRQAVISRAVTKGLNLNAPMKPSGIEWLGNVPVHWKVCDLNHALNGIGDVDHYMPESVDKGVPYVMTGDLTEFASGIDFERCKQVSHNDYLKLSERIKSSKGDVVMARYATIGTASYIDVDREFLVSYSCVTIKPSPSKALGLYIFNYLTAVDPVAAKWQAEAEEEQVDYKSKARDFVKLYAFISHLVPLRDTGLEKLAVFLRFLLPKLPAQKGELPLEVLGMVDMEKLAVRKNDKKDIGLKRGETKVDPLNYGGGATLTEEERQVLSQIIEDLNTRFNTSFTEDEIMVIKQLEKKIGEDEALQQQLKNGSRHAIEATFQQVAKDAFEDLVNGNFEFYKKVNDDEWSVMLVFRGLGYAKLPVS